MLVIKPHTIKDVPLRVKWLNNPLVSAYIGEEPMKRTTLKAQLKWFEDYRKNKQKIFFTICSDKVSIGFMGLSNINRKNKNADIFIAIGENAFRGKGYGEQALEWLLQYAFTKLDLHKVNLGVIKENRAAIALYKKLGFKVEGRMREEVWLRGAWHTMFSMALFRKDFLK